MLSSRYIHKTIFRGGFLMVPQRNKKGKEYVVVKTFAIYFNDTVMIVAILKEEKTLKTEMMS